MHSSCMEPYDVTKGTGTAPSSFSGSNGLSLGFPLRILRLVQQCCCDSSGTLTIETVDTLT